MLNEKQIEYLLTVAEERNITSAARKLYISQPALSRMILDLEHSLGFALFIRDRGNLHPTQAGEIYLRGCRDVLAVSQSVLKRIWDINNGQSGRILFGATSQTAEFLFPSIIERFEKTYPNVELILVEDRMTVLQELVKSGKVDLALVYQTGDPNLEYLPVLDSPIYLQVPPFYLEGKLGWQPGIDNPSISPKSLENQPMVLLKKGRGMREVADRFLVQNQISPSKITETENIRLARNLVQLNKGFTFVPSIAIHDFLRENGASTYCQITGSPIKRSLYVCFRKYGYFTEAERFLINLIPKVSTPF